MTATARVRHLIEVEPAPHALPVVFEFESRDIGYTQGTTIRYNGVIIANYRPGTRYWDTAVEVATKVLAGAVDYAASDGTWSISRFEEKLAELLKTEQCTPWDGRDLGGDE